ncbi:MAG: ECF-type sigma factor [Gemmataceae bacterium]|nr:ECF-type sigma factor [Gemmataceae bacterium]
MNDVTQILNAIDAGDAQAAAQLLPLVYDELRRLAAQKLAGEKPGHTLDATALVHEAYLRLVGPENAATFVNSRHFFATAAEAMRRILVESARKKRSQKRGGDRQRADLDLARAAAPTTGEDLLAVDEALNQLAEKDPQAAELVKLRYYVGLSLPEIAEILKISARSADRVWAYARAWLRRAVGEA